MGVLTRTCDTLTCDVCADGWAELDVEPHFPSGAVAKRYAAANGWVVTAVRAVCPACLPVEACATGGHLWRPWTRAGPFPSSSGGSWEGRVRHCRNCSSAEWDPPVRRRDLGDQTG